MTFKHEIRKLFRRTGFDVARYEPQLHAGARRERLFSLFRIDLVLDVGANTGQYANYLRGDAGYKGRIVSFEPLKTEFGELARAAADETGWETFNFALGEREYETEINIAGNSYSSSLLPMERSHVDAAPESAYVGRETIRVKTLDSVFGEIHNGEKSVLLKIDTQGFEKAVLDGAVRSLEVIDTLQLEMSLVPVYEGGPLFEEIYSFVLGKGYKLAAVEEVFWNQNTGQLLQIDGIFHRF